MPKNINCFTIIITLEGVKKIKSQKIQQNSLNEKIHFKPAKTLRFSPQSTPQLKAKSLRSLKPSFFPFFHAMIASSLYHENFFFWNWYLEGKRVEQLITKGRIIKLLLLNVWNCVKYLKLIDTFLCFLLSQCAAKDPLK